jgi:hypothetical protein
VVVAVLLELTYSIIPVLPGVSDRSRSEERGDVCGWSGPGVLDRGAGLVVESGA